MTATDTLGVVLAGGASSRMGGTPKATLSLGPRTLLARAVERLAPQVGTVVVNANDPLETGGLPLVRDGFEDRRGPLAGILAAMEWAASHAPGATVVASVAVDTPFFPDDLVSRLHAARRDSIALVQTGEWPQPTFGLWPVALAPRLRAFLEGDGRKIMQFARQEGFATAPFDERDFENVNTPDDLAAARARLTA